MSDMPPRWLRLPRGLTPHEDLDWIAGPGSPSSCDQPHSRGRPRYLLVGRASRSGWGRGL